MNSNAALAELRPALIALGFEIEAGKKLAERIRRPALFGDEGAEDLAYEVDRFHPELGIALEVEAGRCVPGNAILALHRSSTGGPDPCCDISNRRRRLMFDSQQISKRLGHADRTREAV